MGLLDKLEGPIFYKKSSNSEIQLEHLKNIRDNVPDEVKKQIDKEIKLLSYGISGEQNVAFELMNSFIPMIILKDLYYEYEGISAQIDYLVITRKLIIIIECKNLFGNIEINSNGDFIRTIEFNGKERKEGIYSPVTQNKRHLDLLKKIGCANKKNRLLRALFKKIFDYNYKSIIVLANPKTIINTKYAKKEVKEQIIRCDHLIEYIKKLNKESKNESCSDKDMYEIAETLLNRSTDNNSDYTNKYNVHIIKEEIPEYTTKIEEQKLINNTTEDNLENTPIYQELKTFRYNRSKEENVKPYFIYNNSQLKQLIQRMPKSCEEIKLISGFGDVKCKKYGEDILKILDKYKW